MLELPPRYAPVLEHLGKGGFANVYRSVDLELERPVAIKVPFRSGEGSLAAEISAELRATAGLRHPNILQFVDSGVLADGHPYLVMEYAPGGALSSLLDEPPPWSELLPLLVGILDGLGHAHAAGMVHRDIKPENILLREGANGAQQALLSDFGLAKVLDEQGAYQSTRMGGGTVLYMAPEQFGSDTSAIHPAADLYSFGVLLYTLLAGCNPWALVSVNQLIFAKVTGSPKDFVARPGYSVPSGIEEILTRLLQPQPWHRYSLASDVAASLLRLEPTPALDLSTTTVPNAGSSWASVDASRDVDLDAVGSEKGRLPLDPPPPHRAPAWPPSASVNAVREPLLVGREGECARLWAAARAAASQPIGLALLGSQGVGRSRLCRWLGRTLEEEGLARAVHVRLDASVGPMQGFSRGLRQLLGLGRLVGEELEERLDGFSGDWGSRRREVARTLRAWLDPASRQGETSRLEPSQCLAAAERVLRAEARRGLAVLWIEERAGGVGGLRLALRVLRGAASRPFPLLVLYDPPSDSSGECGETELEALQILGLADEATRRLILDLLPEPRPELVQEVLDRSKGVPALAVQWSRLSSQRPSTKRAAAAASDSPGLGGDVTQAVPSPLGSLAGSASLLSLVRARLQAFFGGLPREVVGDEEGAEQVLGLLAILPRPVPPGWIVAVLERLGRDSSRVTAILQQARAAGLVSAAAGGGLDLAVPQLIPACRERLEARVDREELMAAAAEVLLEQEDGVRPALRAAAGALLVRAGQADRALEVLSAAGQLLLERDIDAARRVFDEAGRVANSLGLAAGDPKCVEILLGASQAARNAGELDLAQSYLEPLDGEALEDDSRAWVREARGVLAAVRGELVSGLEHARAAREGFEASGNRLGLARTRHLAGDILHRMGKLEESAKVFSVALELARDVGSVHDTVDCMWRLARVHRARGEHEAALAGFQEVLERSQGVGDARIEGMALRELGNLALARERGAEAKQLLEGSLARLEAAGCRAESVSTRISLGELARANEDFAEARKHYASALLAADAHDLSIDAVVALLDLALTELSMGRARRAARRLASLDERIPPAQPSRYRPWIELLRLAVLAGEGRWDAADQHLEELDSLQLPSGDRDALFLVELAAVAAVQGGELALAHDVCELASDLTSPDEAEALQRRIAALAESSRERSSQ